MKNYKNNLELLSKNHVYSHEMEHDACGVGLIASTEGKKSRAVVEHGIEALKAVWHRGAPRCQTALRASIPCSTTALDFFPSVEAIRPTPQASCSIS